MSTIGIVRWILTIALVSSIFFSGSPALAEASISGIEDLPRAGVEPSTEPAIGSEIVVSALNNEQVQPAVAYNRKHREYLVVWQNNWPGNRDVYGQRTGEDGKLRSWFAISAGPNDRVQPSVAYDPVNDRYLVTWAYDVSGNNTNWDVRGRIIPWDGPSPALTEFVICDWPTTQWNPEVAYGQAQEEFLVVWWTDHPSVPDYVSGRRISASAGAPADSPFAIAHHPSQQRILPDVAYNLSRNEYLVTYHDGLDIWGRACRATATSSAAASSASPAGRMLRSTPLWHPVIRRINTWSSGSRSRPARTTTSTPASSKAPDPR